MESLPGQQTAIVKETPMKFGEFVDMVKDVRRIELVERRDKTVAPFRDKDTDGEPILGKIQHPEKLHDKPDSPGGREKWLKTVYGDNQQSKPAEVPPAALGLPGALPELPGGDAAAADVAEPEYGTEMTESERESVIRRAFRIGDSHKFNQIPISEVEKFSKDDAVDVFAIDKSGEPYTILFSAGDLWLSSLSNPSFHYVPLEGREVFLNNLVSAYTLNKPDPWASDGALDKTRQELVGKAAEISPEVQEVVSKAIDASAREGKEVLLIDSNIANPSIGSIFGVRDQRGGLADALAGTTTLDEVIHDTEIPGLRIVLAGNTSLRPVRLQAVLDRAKDIADVVLYTVPLESEHEPKQPELPPALKGIALEVLKSVADAEKSDSPAEKLNNREFVRDAREFAYGMMMSQQYRLKKMVPGSVVSFDDPFIQVGFIGIQGEEDSRYWAQVTAETSSIYCQFTGSEVSREGIEVQYLNESGEHILSGELASTPDPDTILPGAPSGDSEAAPELPPPAVLEPEAEAAVDQEIGENGLTAEQQKMAEEVFEVITKSQNIDPSDLTQARALRETGVFQKLDELLAIFTKKPSSIDPLRITSAYSLMVHSSSDSQSIHFYEGTRSLGYYYVNHNATRLFLADRSKAPIEKVLMPHTDRVLDKMELDPLVNEVPAFASEMQDRPSAMRNRRTQEEISDDEVAQLPANRNLAGWRESQRPKLDSEKATDPGGDTTAFEAVNGDTAEFSPVVTGPETDKETEPEPVEITPAAVGDEDAAEVVVEPLPEAEEEVAEAEEAAEKPPVGTGSGLQEWDQAFVSYTHPTPPGLETPPTTPESANQQTVATVNRILPVGVSVSATLPANGAGRVFPAVAPVRAPLAPTPPVAPVPPSEGREGELSDPILTGTEEDEAAHQADALTPHPDAEVRPKGDQEGIVLDSDRTPPPAVASGGWRRDGTTTLTPNRVLPNEEDLAPKIVRAKPATPLPLVRAKEPAQAGDPIPGIIDDFNALPKPACGQAESRNQENPERNRKIKAAVEQSFEIGGEWKLRRPDPAIQYKAFGDTINQADITFTLDRYMEVGQHRSVSMITDFRLGGAYGFEEIAREFIPKSIPTEDADLAKTAIERYINSPEFQQIVQSSIDEQKVAQKAAEDSKKPLNQAMAAISRVNPFKRNKP